jgi:hypothetical protein
MGMSEREHHIKVLENLLSHYKAREKCEGYYDSTLKDNVEALQYAISSLKTDEAYQLMYEDVEVYDKDTVAWMFRELQLEIEELEKPHCHNASHADGCVSKWKVEGVIQQKINALKGE